MCPQVCVANKTILNSCLMLAYFVSVTWICESDASGITKIRVPRFFSFMSQTFFKEETHVIFFLFQLYKHLTQSKYWNNFLFVQHPLHTWVDMLSCKILCHVKWSRSKHQIIFADYLRCPIPSTPISVLFCFLSPERIFLTSVWLLPSSCEFDTWDIVIRQKSKRNDVTWN